MKTEEKNTHKSVKIKNPKEIEAFTQSYWMSSWWFGVVCINRNIKKKIGDLNSTTDHLLESSFLRHHVFCAHTTAEILTFDNCMRTFLLFDFVGLMHCYAHVMCGSVRSHCWKCIALISPMEKRLKWNAEGERERERKGEGNNKFSVSPASYVCFYFWLSLLVCT